MEWYQWVFSGIGAAAIAVLAGRFFDRRTASQNPIKLKGSRQESEVKVSGDVAGPAIGSVQGDVITTTNIQMPAGSEQPAAKETPGPELNRTKPTPFEINNEIGRRPPFERDTAAGLYTGLPVVWDLRFSSLDKKTANEVSLSTYYRDIENPKSLRFETVVFTVSLDAYPQIKRWRSGEQIVARGVIAKITRGPLIYLRDVTLVQD